MNRTVPGYLVAVVAFAMACTSASNEPAVSYAPPDTSTTCTCTTGSPCPGGDPSRCPTTDSGGTDSGIVDARCRETGGTCGAGTDCCSGSCDASTCAKCLATGVNGCSANADCCTGFCAGGAPPDPPPFCSCRPEGYACTEGWTCCTGVCLEGQCNKSPTCFDPGTLHCEGHKATCCAPSICATTPSIPFPTCCIPSGGNCSADPLTCCNGKPCNAGKCS